MNFIKCFFYTIALIASHNALGMMGFGHALTTSKAPQHGNLEFLGILYVHPNNQSEFFDYINTNNIDTPRFQILLKKAQLKQCKALKKEKTVLTNSENSNYTITKENPSLTTLKNSKHIVTNSYASLEKLPSKSKKLNITISKNEHPTKVLSERNK